MKSPLQWLALASVTMVSGISFSQQTLYVSTTGSDASNNCLTPGSPCGTISHAYSQATASDTIKIAPGNYNLTATLNLLQSVVLTGADPVNMPVITSTASDVISVNSDDVTISNIKLQMGLTGSTGLRGIVANTGNFDNLKITNNVFESVNPISGTPNTNMVWTAYAISLVSAAGDVQNVTIEDNEIIAGATANVFGRGIFLGNGGLGLDAPGGTISGNTIKAYYAIQSVLMADDLLISDNDINGTVLISSPRAGVVVDIENNDLGNDTQMTPASYYAVLELRSVELGDVNVTNNQFNNYVNIGLLSEASKNVVVAGNTFTPAASATTFASIMANTKLMTNGVQGNTYSDEIVITGNTFAAASGTTGSAIVFADHYGVHTPAFASITVGGPTAAEKNTFAAGLGNFITLDAQTGASTSFPLWAPYPATTMKPFAQDVNAYGVYNNYGLTTFAAVEAKNQDQSDNAVLGKVHLSAAGTNRYVSTTGSDDVNACTLPGSPCLTIAHALSVAIDEDSVIVAPGNYALTSVLNISQEGLVLTAQDENNKPVLTTNQGTVIDINAEDVSINALRLEMGLTATTGKYGIISTTNLFDSLSLTKNEIVSTSPVIPYGMVWDAFAVRLNSGTNTNTSVNIQDNKIGEAVAGTNNIFGRGISLGSATSDGPGGIVANNDIMAYYTVQAIRSQEDMYIHDNTLAGITMVNTPLSYTHAYNNIFDGLTPMSMDSLYALVELRSVENESVLIENNEFVNYKRIALLSEASKNVTVRGNEFNPSTSATAFVSLMANTKLMTNGVQGNTYSDEIEITGNTFNAAAAGVGTAISFADHYGANTPAFNAITIGGTTAAEKNTFDTDLGSYIALDELTGASTAFPLWAPYPATTMVPFAQDVEALAINNNYGLVDFAAIEAKNHDVLENAALGKVIIKSAGDNRYVATTGNNVSNDCTLPGSPCLTIEHALSVAIDADSVIVSAGNYALTSVLNITQDDLTLTAANVANKPVITTNQANVIDVNAENVEINGFEFAMGLTATTGIKGIVSTANNFNHLTVKNNDFVSSAALDSEGMVWSAFAVQLSSAAGQTDTVTITDNTVATSAANLNVFGRGFYLGSGSTNAPGGLIANNNIKAYYAIQTANVMTDLTIESNDINGITMLNVPHNNAAFDVHDNTFSGANMNANMTSDSLYAIIDIRGIEDGSVDFYDNTLENYSTIGVLSMASKNVSLDANSFEPKGTASNFISIMANTKLMTNGVQGNTYSDEIEITGNTFAAGAANGGTAIVFADHYGVNTPAFASVTIGGATAAEKNTFNTSLGKYIVLDDKTGSSATYALWAPYAVTTMKPFTQDIEALYVNNVYNFGSTGEVELKNIDSVDNNILGKVILAHSFVGLDELTATTATLYPNPAISSVTIELTDKNAVAELTIVDLFGKVVYTSSVAGTESVDVSNFTSGVYVVRLTNNGQTSSTRFVKN